MTNRDGQAAWDYHRATNHSEASLRADVHALDFSNQPLPFKVYSALEAIPLARDFSSAGVPALLAIGGGGALAGDSVDAYVPSLVDVSRLLYCSAGVLRRKKYPGGETFFRAYPNTGALYHIDLYLVCADLPDLAAGVYHFSPHDFALRRLRAGDHRAVLVEATGAEPAVAAAPLIVASASTYWRNAWKYRSRAYRHCFWDAGTMHANLLAIAATGGLTPRLVLGFADGPVDALLGLNPREEGALALVALGRTPAPPPPAADVPLLRLDTVPLSREPIDYPAIREMHAASALATGADAAGWRGAAPDRAMPEPAARCFPLRPLPDDALPEEALERVILRRGSTRHFDPGAACSFEELSTLLDRSARSFPCDFLADPVGSLIDVYLIVHAVADLPPGAYYYRRDSGALELLHEGDFRGHAGRLGLFQQLPADAAVNLYCMTDLAAVLDRFGNRGYRAAQFEGAIFGGRMYLAAYAQGFGATGLTFLDDEVTDFFSPHAAGKSVMFLTAVGRPHRRGATPG